MFFKVINWTKAEVPADRETRSCILALNREKRIGKTVQNLLSIDLNGRPS